MTDTAALRSITNASDKNKLRIRKYVRLIENEISGYRIVAMESKGTALGSIANQTANRIQSQLDYALRQKGN